MYNLTRGERFKDARTVHNKNGSQSMGEVAKATGVYASTITDLENDDTVRSVGYDKIATLARHYGVSADYLLGLSPNPTVDKDLDAVCKYTGLSQKSVQSLCTRKSLEDKSIAFVIDELLLDLRYHNIDEYHNRHYRPVLTLLNYFFNFTNSGNRKQIYSNGTITDCRNDSFISGNAIELNDTVIENAVLAEIQLALINLKRQREETEGK